MCVDGMQVQVYNKTVPNLSHKVRSHTKHTHNIVLLLSPTLQYTRIPPKRNSFPPISLPPRQVLSFHRRGRCDDSRLYNGYLTVI